jgi:hypothetical protein
MSSTEDPDASQMAQPPGLKRTDLQRNDLSVPGREVIQSRVEIGPEAPFVKHTHPVKRSSTSSKNPWSM